MKIWADILALALNNQIDTSICGNHMKTDGWISIWLLQSIFNKQA